MSNYPPGVTGMEYEISGPDYEETEAVECDEECLYVPAHLVETAIVTAGDRLNRALTGQGVQNEIRDALADLTYLREALGGEGTQEGCGFEGDVDVAGYRGQKWWTCPRCGAEHSEYMEEEGPDDDRI